MFLFLLKCFFGVCFWFLMGRIQLPAEAVAVSEEVDEVEARIKRPAPTEGLGWFNDRLYTSTFVFFLFGVFFLNGF